MSLINQALRKAQRDRTPNRMPEPGEQSPAAQVSTAASGMSPALLIGLVIALALLIGVVVGLSIVIFKGDSEQIATQTSPATTTTPATAPMTAPEVATQPVTSQPLATPETQPIASPVIAEAPATQAAPAPPVVEELRRVREEAEAQAAAEIRAAEEAAARAAAEPSQEIITWLGTARISGVRISDTESKVLLNGDSYSQGEYVNFALGLKVLIIQQERVLFEDENGKRYMKRL